MFFFSSSVVTIFFDGLFLWVFVFRVFYLLFLPVCPHYMALLTCSKYQHSRSCLRGVILTFRQVFNDGGWMVAIKVDIVDCAIWFFAWLI